MKIVIASDSFKESASSVQVANALAAGMSSIEPDLDILKLAVADGGEGTGEALAETLGAEQISLVVHNPLGKKITVNYILSGEKAVIDMSAASGLSLLSVSERDPYKTSTYGTGEMILDAVEKGANKIYLGLGGSATNDGGIGMAMALGVRALNASGTTIAPGAAGLAELHDLDLSTLDSRLGNVKFIALCDVKNPLSGNNGAAYVFAVQKGAKDKDLADLDRILHRYGVMLEQKSGKQVISRPGAGAAGGMGAALIAILRAELKSGIDTVLDLLNFEEKICDADLLISGEGRIDNSSLSGKTIMGIAKRAKKLSVPVIAVVGSYELNLDSVYEHGIDLILPIINQPMTLKAAMEKVDLLLFEAGKNIIRLLKFSDLIKYNN
ncbi:MAG: glycerate kinase [Fastidiosipila sp.]|nr:glycerate kinase [Fastidiosipila sp.]